VALRERLSLIRSPKAAGLRSVAEASAFGFVSYTTVALLDRLYVGLDTAERPPSVMHGEADIDVTHVSTPLDFLIDPSLQLNDAWPTETKKSIRRFEALWLLVEDRFRLLDAAVVEPLAHQASLVEHILSAPDLSRVLIADEVGLGKTVEAGLIIKRLAERSASPIRVLYLTEARLVRNVVDEFEKLGLRPREWSSQRQEARLVPDDSDPLVIASMHRAVVNADLVAASGPWNVIIVDEAHHLTDWSEDGSDPQQRMRLCRRLLRERLVPGGRVILLSGTPHQGSEERFKNLLRLLDEAGNAGGARGRVIYRIKDDITDWDGQPLFPKRQVNAPTDIDAGEEYSRWLTQVHELLTPYSGSRAAGWRRAQALQWCASSPQAGLAYLVRLAMRAGLTRRTTPVIARALAALRPYRAGSENDPVESVEAALMRAQEVMEDGAEEVFQDPRRGLNAVLQLGVALVEDDALKCKLDPVFAWLKAEADEKFVVFAQPVDTVYTLKYRLERELGRDAVSLIVGGQNAVQRDAEIDAFKTRSERRVLVSSRSGGEGINLQIARRLIHFDVPWNPMEMEQRVGRIHRYGSANTVIVDTLVLKDSREQRVLARSRARLGRIARDLDQDRMEILFSRTMSLIPMEDLAALMAGENFGPLTPDDEARIDQLITEGYHRWTERDREFRSKSEKLRGMDRGAATPAAYRSFLVDTLGAEPVAGWKRRAFKHAADDGAPVLSETVADVLKLPGGSMGYIGRDAGIGLSNGTGASAQLRSLGLNDPIVAELVRRAAGEDGAAKQPDASVNGAGLVLINDNEWKAFLGATGFAGVGGGVLLAYLTRALDLGASMNEVSAGLHCWIVSPDARNSVRLPPVAVGQLLNSIRVPRTKRIRPTNLDAPALREFESECLRTLGRQAASDPFVAVFPLAALWLEPTAEPGAGGDSRAG
jgi:superfamily II DNA or RNA helicase